MCKHVMLWSFAQPLHTHQHAEGHTGQHRRAVTHWHCLLTEAQAQDVLWVVVGANAAQYVWLFVEEGTNWCTAHKNGKTPGRQALSLCFSPPLCAAPQTNLQPCNTATLLCTLNKSCLRPYSAVGSYDSQCRALYHADGPQHLAIASGGGGTHFCHCTALSDRCKYIRALSQARLAHAPHGSHSAPLLASPSTIQRH